MAFGEGDSVFVDESKSHRYYIAAAAVARGNLAATERQIRGLQQSRRPIHFTHERDRREKLLAEFCKLDVRVTVYAMRGVKDAQARPALLQRLTHDLVERGVAELVLERDASVEAADRRIIRNTPENAGALNMLVYRHEGKERPMLWVADAVAWCFQRGRPWTAKVQPLIDNVVTLPRP